MHQPTDAPAAQDETDIDDLGSGFDDVEQALDALDRDDLDTAEAVVD